MIYDLMKCEDDLKSWDKWLEACRLFDEPVENRGGELAGAIQYLRGILGEDFLNRFYQTNHPMFTFFFQWPEAWRMRRLARLAKAIERLDGEALNFGPLVRKLKDPRGSDPAEESGDALTVLETADKFLRQGFTISF